MRYYGTVIRPPSEAESYILQVTKVQKGIALPPPRHYNDWTHLRALAPLRG